MEEQRLAVEADNKIAAANEKRIEELEAKAKEVLANVKNPDASCLDAGDVDRLRGLWSEGNK
jgi:hypothetical protein